MKVQVQMTTTTDSTLHPKNFICHLYYKLFKTLNFKHENRSNIQTLRKNYKILPLIINTIIYYTIFEYKVKIYHTI